MKIRILILCLFTGWIPALVAGQPATTPAYSLKNYCKARILLAQLRSSDPEEPGLEELVNRITRLSQDEYLLREVYKQSFIKYLVKDPLKAFIYARRAIGHGAEPGCFNHIFPASQAAVLAAERRRYVSAQYNPGLANFFESLREADQYYRVRDLRSAASPDLPLIRQKMLRQDGMNEASLLKFILANGWPAYRSIDTVDCNYSITSSFASMMSHWHTPYIDAIYRYAVMAAQAGLMPWFLPISINNYCLTRRPYILDRFFSFFDFEFLYTGLPNLKTKPDGGIDWSDDQTILEFLSLGYRMTASSTDIIVLFCSPAYARPGNFALQELNRAKNLLILLGNQADRIRICPPSASRLAVLPGDHSLIGAWTIHYGAHPTIISQWKDTWLLDNKLNTDDLDNFFLQ